MSSSQPYWAVTATMSCMGGGRTTINQALVTTLILNGSMSVGWIFVHAGEGSFGTTTAAGVFRRFGFRIITY